MNHYLKKGTIVKHGTTSKNLLSIFQKGILASYNRSEMRSINEASPFLTNVVYVAKDLIAYSSSYIAFAADMKNVSVSSDADASVPVVLNIELKSDCLIIADEDYPEVEVGETYNIEQLLKVGKNVWEKYGSVGLVLEHGIPSNWIQSFEYPCIKSFNPKNLEKIHRDVLVLLIAYAKNHWGKISKEYYDYFQQQNERLSNAKKFNKESINEFLNTSRIKDKKKLKKFSTDFWNYTTDRGFEMGLPFD